MTVVVIMIVIVISGIAYGPLARAGGVRRRARRKQEIIDTLDKEDTLFDAKYRLKATIKEDECTP